MPRPEKGESQGHYVQRFMGSSEAQSSFPDPKQRYAVSMSMYRQRHQVKKLRERRNKD